MSGPKAQPMSNGPVPQPMTGNPPPQEIPASHPMGQVPHGHTHVIRMHFASGWDTYNTYASRDEAMEAYRQLVKDGQRPGNMIVSRV